MFTPPITPVKPKHEKEVSTVKRVPFMAITVVALSSILLTGCSSSSNPTPTSSATKTPSTSKPAPTQSSSPIPTETSTPTVTPTPTSVPSTTPSTPTNTKPATPSAAPKPVVHTTVVVIGADDLRFEKLNGTVLKSFPYNQSPAAAVTALNELYGKQPDAKHYSTEEMCSYQFNTWAWDNMSITFTSGTKDPATAKSFFVTSAKPNQNYERVVETPNEIQVGNSWKVALQKAPGAIQGNTASYNGHNYQTLIADHTSDTQYDKITPDGSKTVGTIVTADNGVVTGIHSPFSLYGDC
jgi:hypothetical protein